jgi:hypothetical protein
MDFVDHCITAPPALDRGLANVAIQRLGSVAGHSKFSQPSDRFQIVLEFANTTFRRRDCSPDICYEGTCLPHVEFTTDGTCGYDPNYGLLSCAGEWGDCCNLLGKCGTGDEYCGEAICQSGNCASPNVALLHAPIKWNSGKRRLGAR